MAPIIRVTVAVAIALLGTVARSAEAQAPFCFRAHQLEQCRAHLVSEAGIAVTSADEDPYLTLEAGALLNVGLRARVSA